MGVLLGVILSLVAGHSIVAVLAGLSIASKITLASELVSAAPQVLTGIEDVNQIIYELASDITLPAPLRSQLNIRAQLIANGNTAIRLQRGIRNQWDDTSY